MRQMIRELRRRWLNCKLALDMLDAEYLATRSFHTDICCCVACKQCAAWYYDTPEWQRSIATMIWGKP